MIYNEIISTLCCVGKSDKLGQEDNIKGFLIKWIKNITHGVWLEVKLCMAIKPKLFLGLG